MEGRSKAIRAVVFDIGGILELTPDTGWRARWEERHGLAVGDIDRRLLEVWKAGSVGTIAEAEVERRIAEILGLDDTQLSAFVHEMWEDYLGTPNHALIAYFQSLRSRCLTGIISNSFVGATERERARYGFDAMCDHIVYSHEAGLEKPDPRIYARWCDRMGVRPDEVVFLDDRPEHVAGARAFGMHAVLFEDNGQAIAAIEALLASGG